MSIVEPEDVERAEGNAVHHMNERLIPPREKLSVRGGDKCVGGEDDSSIGMVLFSTVVSVCGSFEFGTCVGFSAPTEAEIKNDLGLSMAEYSFFGSILTVGAMVGAITSGRIADYVGRKRTMTLSALFCIIGWLALFLSRSALMLDTGRLLTGYGTGILSYVVPIYIAEIAPKHLRGGLATLNQFMIVCGATVPFLIGTLVSWRTLTLTGLTPCFIMLIGLIFIPESPRWLANVGLHKEFTASLKTLRGKDADISLEASEIQDYIETLKLLPKSAILDLFQRSYIRPLTIAAGLMSLQQLGGINGIGFYASEIFVSAGFSSGKQGTIAYACVQVPITMISAILVDRSGRRPLLLVSATGTFFGCVLTATSFLLKFSTFIGFCFLLPESRIVVAMRSFLSNGWSSALTALHIVVLRRNGRYPMGDHVGDIPFERKGSRRKLRHLDGVAMGMARLVHVQLSGQLERFRHFLRLRCFLCTHSRIRSNSCAGNERENIGKDTALINGHIQS